MLGTELQNLAACSAQQVRCRHIRLWAPALSGRGPKRHQRPLQRLQSEFKAAKQRVPEPKRLVKSKKFRLARQHGCNSGTPNKTQHGWCRASCAAYKFSPFGTTVWSTQLKHATRLAARLCSFSPFGTTFGARTARHTVGGTPLPLPPVRGHRRPAQLAPPPRGI